MQAVRKLSNFYYNNYLQVFSSLTKKGRITIVNRFVNLRYFFIVRK